MIGAPARLRIMAFDINYGTPGALGLIFIVLAVFSAAIVFRFLGRAARSAEEEVTAQEEDERNV